MPGALQQCLLFAGTEGILHFCTPQHRIILSADFGSRGLTCMTLPPFLVHVGLLSKHRPVGHLFGIDPDGPDGPDGTLSSPLL